MVRLHGQRHAEGGRLSVVTLKCTDQARNVSQFYLLAVQPELFGRWSLVREWGRIGSPGQTCIVSYVSQAEAQTAFTRHCKSKEKRGYR